MSGSSLLAQQQLVEPAPRRRLIVPVGHTAYYGLDLGTTRLAAAYVTVDGARGCATAPFAKLKGSTRLSHIYAVSRAFMTHLVADCRWPRA
jgi:hypothetical protein